MQIPATYEPICSNLTNDIILFGDSIFDNQPYVRQGESVSSQLQAIIDSSTYQGNVNLYAVDGDVLADIPAQLSKVKNDNNTSSGFVFVSCGGNDLLHYQASGLLNQNVTSFEDALTKLGQLRTDFQQRYQTMLASILAQHSNVVVCTIYDCVPNLSVAQKTAIASFNEIILKEAMVRNLGVIDLRTLCNEFDDYAPVSPIEPSRQGAEKIANAIFDIWEDAQSITKSASNHSAI